MKIDQNVVQAQVRDKQPWLPVRFKTQTPLRWASSSPPLTTTLRIEASVVEPKKSLTMKKCARRSPVCGLERASNAFTMKIMLRSDGTSVKWPKTVAVRRVCKMSEKEHQLTYIQKVILGNPSRAAGRDLPRNGVRKVEIQLNFWRFANPDDVFDERIFNQFSALPPYLQCTYTASTFHYTRYLPYMAFRTGFRVKISTFLLVLLRWGQLWTSLTDSVC